MQSCAQLQEDPAKGGSEGGYPEETCDKHYKSWRILVVGGSLAKN